MGPLGILILWAAVYGALPPAAARAMGDGADPTAARDCAGLGKLDFFPAGYTNQPPAWSRRNQLKAGNEDRHSLFPIGLFGSPTPKLHFAPQHPLLVPSGKPIPQECIAVGQWRRRALGESIEWGTVLSPANFTWTTTLNGGKPTPGNETVDPEDATDIPHWTMPVWDLRDGAHTLTITIRIEARSATIEDGPYGRRVPDRDLFFNHTVTFYKLGKRPRMKLTFSTCAPTLELHASNMWPDPVAAPGGLGALFKPVFHVWGTYKQGLDGSSYQGEDLTHGGDVHFFDQYWIRQIGSPRSVTVPLTGVRQGLYELFVEGSLTSDMPSLLSLPGNDTFNANDTDPNWMYIQPGGTLSRVGVSLRGQPKFSGILLPGLNGTDLGVQNGNTTLVSFEGPAQSFEVGERATFSWQFMGLGNTTCAIDGKPVSNDKATGGCKSPLTVKVKDAKRHRLVVTLADVCGGVRRESMNYSVTDGWSTDATPDELPAAPVADLSPPIVGVPAPRTPEAVRSSAGAARRGAAGAVAAAAAVVVALLL